MLESVFLDLSTGYTTKLKFVIFLSHSECKAVDVRWSLQSK